MEDPFLNALIRWRSAGQLEDDIKRLLADAAQGVTVAAYSFEGQSTSFNQHMKIDVLIGYLQTAYDILTGRAAGAGRYTHVDFSRRRIEI